MADQRDPGQRALVLLARLLHRGRFSVTDIELGMRLDGLTLKEAIEDVLRDAGITHEPT